MKNQANKSDDDLILKWHLSSPNNKHFYLQISIHKYWEVNIQNKYHTQPRLLINGLHNLQLQLSIFHKEICFLKIEREVAHLEEFGNIFHTIGAKYDKDRIPYNSVLGLLKQ